MPDLNEYIFKEYRQRIAKAMTEGYFGSKQLAEVAEFCSLLSLDGVNPLQFLKHMYEEKKINCE